MPSSIRKTRLGDQRVGEIERHKKKASLADKVLAGQMPRAHRIARSNTESSLRCTQARVLSAKRHEGKGTQ